MSDSEFDEGCPRAERRHSYGHSEGQRDKSNASQRESAYIAEVFRELFNLLEEYAPVWYTEEQHKRAVAALRYFEES